MTVNSDSITNNIINEPNSQKSSSIKEIVPTGRQYRPWQWLKVWGCPEPSPLRDVGIELDVYDKIPQWQPIDFQLANQLYHEKQQLQQISSPLLKRSSIQMSTDLNHDQWWDSLMPERTPLTTIVSHYHHIILTGAAGTGKTSSLRFLMAQCTAGKLLKGCVPLFGSCLDLVRGISHQEKSPESNPLYIWLKRYLENQKFNDEKQIQLALNKGLFWLLLDELDDIPSHQQRYFIQEILNFQLIYPKVRIIIATRHSEIGQILSGFNTFTLAPLTAQQIRNYLQNWFKSIALSDVNHETQTETLISIIEQKPELYSLATHPLILGYIGSRFNTNQSFNWDFYQEVIELTLWHWDHSKLTPWNQSEVSLSQHIEYLSYLSITGREQYQCGWQGSKISTLLDDLFKHSQPSTNSTSHSIFDSNILIKEWQNSSLLLKAGSNLAVLRYPLLQDYLVAHRLAARLNRSITKYILEHLSNPSWHRIIILTTCLTNDPETLLRQMKTSIDQMIIDDSHLQSFLMWVNQQVMHLTSEHSNASLRALYFDLELEKTRILDRARALDIAHARSLERAHLKAMGKNSDMETDIDVDQSINLALNLDLALYVSQHRILELACAISPSLKRERDHLLRSLPNPIKDRESFPRWWQVYGLDWAKKLRTLIIQNRKSVQEWQFSQSQEQLLRDYAQANLVFAECLRQCQSLSLDFCRQMQNTMLLPSGDFTILQP